MYQLNGNPMPLKYLFKATFQDGSVIEQTPDDRSANDPENRSQFFDALERSKNTRMTSFLLQGQGHEYAVDLTDGHFEIDGVPFRMIEGMLPYYEIVFFRRHTHDFVAGTGQETNHSIVYRLGWQCNDDGKNYQRVMEID
jgi:hypothetical protein